MLFAADILGKRRAKDGKKCEKTQKAGFMCSLHIEYAGEMSYYYN